MSGGRKKENKRRGMHERTHRLVGDAGHGHAERDGHVEGVEGRLVPRERGEVSFRSGAGGSSSVRIGVARRRERSRGGRSSSSSSNTSSGSSSY